MTGSSRIVRLQDFTLILQQRVPSGISWQRWLLTIRASVFCRFQIMERFYSSERIKMVRLREPEFPWNIAMIFKKEKLITAQMKDFIHFVVDNTDTVKEYT